jgi:hypothetical protein
LPTGQVREMMLVEDWLLIVRDSVLASIFSATQRKKTSILNHIAGPSESGCGGQKERLSTNQLVY